ncbi:YybS family protein [Ectobacillus panaciterrae]|uniref:YybS family protein n=1 Tax=Ectobacillus panaciterrae TaxID=363872 RepID=UPI0004009210|nr:YybS family protein [Ectobacillus panaciterrae]
MKNTRWITEGAVLLAVFVILLLASMYIPVLNIVFLLALPLPFIIFAIRNELKYTWILLIAASLITVVVSSPFNIATSLTFGTTGIVLGSMYKRQKKPTDILLAGTIVYIVNFVVLYIVSVLFFEYNFIQEIQDMLKQSLQSAEQIIEATGVQVNKKQLEQLKQLPTLIGYAIPAMLVMGGLMMSWLTIIISAPILKRLRFDVQPWPPFRNVNLPKSVLVYYVIFVIIATFVKIEEGSYLYIALLNLNLIFPLLMAIQGFSVVAFFCHLKGYPKAVPIILFILSFFIPILFSLVSFLGIIDLGFSLRNRFKSI